jgi:putative mRNA 3-end processing factor
VTHGYVAVLVRWLEQHGLQACAFATEYGDDESDRAEDEAELAAFSDEPQARTDAAGIVLGS